MPTAQLPQSNDLHTFVQNNRTLVVGLAVLFFLLGGGAVGYSFITKPTRSITVIGTGKKTLAPEQAVVSFSLLFENPSQQLAISGGETRFAQLLKSVEKFSPASVEATPYQITSRNNSQTTNGQLVTAPVYQYINAARLTINSPQQVNDVIKTLYDNGASIVGQVRYIAKDQDKVDRQLQQLAVQNATDKARDMAQTGGARLGKVLTIQEGTSTGVTGTSVTGSGAPSTGASPAPTTTASSSSNQIELQAQVTVIYELW